MNIIIINRILIKSLKTVSGGIINCPKNNLYVHIVVYKNQITFTVNNSEFEIIHKTFANKIVAQGECFVLFEMIYKVSKSISPSTIVNVFTNKNNIIIKTNNTSAEINRLKYTRYNLLDSYSNIFGTFNINCHSFIQSVSGSSYALPNHNEKTKLNSMFFEINANNFIIIATNGYKFGINKIKIINKNNNYIKAIISHTLVIELLKIFPNTINLNMTFGKRWIKFDSGITSVTSLLLFNFNYPIYKNFLEMNYKNTIIVNRILLKQAFIRASALLNNKNGLLTLEFSVNKIKIIGKNSDIINTNKIEEVISVVYSGKFKIFHFYVKYLLPLLHIMVSKTIKLCFNDSNGPILFEEIKVYGKYIISPIKISKV